MNAPEGLQRIATVVRWLGYLVAGAGVAIAALLFRPSGEDMVVVLVVAALIAAAGWTLAWIIDGFAKPKP